MIGPETRRWKNKTRKSERKKEKEMELNGATWKSTASMECDKIYNKNPPRHF
jgi:hypothetical protein